MTDYAAELPAELATVWADLGKFWTEHGYQLVLGALVITFVLLAVSLLIARRRGYVDRWFANLSSLTVLALSSEGMWVVAVDKLHLAPPLAATVFFVFEATMIANALQAKRLYDATTIRDATGKILTPGHPGKHGTAVWVIATLGGVIVALNSKNPVEFPLRLSLPLMAAYMWWNSLTAEGTSRPQGTWRWTPRRFLLWIGAVEPKKSGLEDVDRERRIKAMTVTARRVHNESWPLRWHTNRLERLAMGADDDMVAEVHRRVKRVNEIRELTAPSREVEPERRSGRRPARVAAAPVDAPPRPVVVTVTDTPADSPADTPAAAGVSAGTNTDVSAPSRPHLVNASRPAPANASQDSPAAGRNAPSKWAPSDGEFAEDRTGDDETDLKLALAAANAGTYESARQAALKYGINPNRVHTRLRNADEPQPASIG